MILTATGTSGKERIQQHRRPTAAAAKTGSMDQRSKAVRVSSSMAENSDK